MYSKIEFFYFLKNIMHAKVVKIAHFAKCSLYLVITTNLIVSEKNMFYFENKPKHTNSIYISHN